MWVQMSNNTPIAVLGVITPLWKYLWAFDLMRFVVGGGGGGTYVFGYSMYV